jgi:hypothetical protein
VPSRRSERSGKAKYTAAIFEKWSAKRKWDGNAYDCHLNPSFCEGSELIFDLSSQWTLLEIVRGPGPPTVPAVHRLPLSLLISSPVSEWTSLAWRKRCEFNPSSLNRVSGKWKVNLNDRFGRRRGLTSPCHWRIWVVLLEEGQRVVCQLKIENDQMRDWIVEDLEDLFLWNYKVLHALVVERGEESIRFGWTVLRWQSDSIFAVLTFRWMKALSLLLPAYNLNSTTWFYPFFISYKCSDSKINPRYSLVIGTNYPDSPRHKNGPDEIPFCGWLILDLSVFEHIIIGTSFDV